MAISQFEIDSFIEDFQWEMISKILIKLFKFRGKLKSIWREFSTYHIEIFTILIIIKTTIEKIFDLNVKKYEKSKQNLISKRLNL
jgi:hypothetical protein